MTSLPSSIQTKPYSYIVSGVILGLGEQQVPAGQRESLAVSSVDEEFDQITGNDYLNYN